MREDLIPAKTPHENFFEGGEKVAGSRQPTELLLVKGKKHLTKAEIEERLNSEIKAKSDKVQAPSYLPNELKEEFNRVANELIEIGIMTNLDCEALARFIVSENQYQKVTAKILKTKNITDNYISLIQLQEKLFKMSRTAASDLGLTISSRCKLVIPKKEEDKKQSKWSKFGG